MKKEKNEVRILRQYIENRERYERLDKIIDQRLQQLLKKHHFFVMDVRHRLKTPTSLKGKLKKKEGKYKDIHELTDLCATRIICYFSDTVDEIANTLRQEFDIDEDNSIDKRAAIGETQFGYLSLHYIASLKKGEGVDDLADIKFEIQIRTVLQHAWAEIEHDLGYKSEFGVPRAMRREFSRIAGLLEIADNQFVSLRNSLNDYTEYIIDKITQDDCDDLLLDQVTIREYIHRNLGFAEFVQSLQDKLHVDYIPSNSENQILQFEWLGIKNLGELQQMINANSEGVLTLLSNDITKYGLDLITSTMILRDLCKVELLKRSFSHDQILRFMMLQTDDPDLAEKRTINLLNQHI